MRRPMRRLVREHAVVILLGRAVLRAAEQSLIRDLDQVLRRAVRGATIEETGGRGTCRSRILEAKLTNSGRGRHAFLMRSGARISKDARWARGFIVPWMMRRMLAEPIELRWVVHEDTRARGFLRDPLGQQIQQQGIVRFIVVLFGWMRPVAAPHEAIRCL